MKTHPLKTHSLVVMSILIAAEIVLSRFLSLAVWNMKIGLAFVPVVIAAIVLGPVEAGIVGGMADFLGAVLFPIGAYFPGFTLSAFLMGAVFGLFLSRNQSFIRILCAVAVNQLLLSLLLNTFWISVLYGSPYDPLLLTRLAQSAIMIPVQLVVVRVMATALVPHLSAAAVNPTPTR